MAPKPVKEPQHTLAHKIELDPNNKQATYFAKACGVARFTYNWGLARWQELYKEKAKPTANKLDKELNEIKKEKFKWMLEVTKCAPQGALADLGDAFKKFFKKLAKYPKFKKK